MNKLKRLVVTLNLTFLLSFTAVAQSGSCLTPTPGETETPPCATAYLATDETTNLDATAAQPPDETVMISTAVYAAVGALMSVF
jgi:hypothetical protein